MSRSFVGGWTEGLTAGAVERGLFFRPIWFMCLVGRSFRVLRLLPVRRDLKRMILRGKRGRRWVGITNSLCLVWSFPWYGGRGLGL